jgi:hypothetical protein
MTVDADATSGVQARADIIIGAAKRAIAEGEAILAHARTLYGLTEDHPPGPLQRAYARRRRELMAAPAPSPKPPDPEPPGYCLSAADGDNVIAVTAMLALARTAGNSGTRKAVYRDIGIHLARLRTDRDQAEWAAIVTRECGLSKRRAYELIAIASGSKPLDRLRAEAAARKQKYNEIKRRASQRSTYSAGGHAYG